MGRLSKTSHKFEGAQIGSLKILSFANKQGSSGSIWNAICLCGNKREISSKEINRGVIRKYNLSCGACEFADRKVNVSDDESAFFNLYSMYKGSAQKRNIEFNLSKKYFLEITSQNCHYCNIKPKQICYNYTRKGKYFYNGIDRLNPEIGYLIQNCVPSCGSCNLMKQSMTFEQFIERVLIIANIYKK